jgi:hypothetical protein
MGGRRSPQPFGRSRQEEESHRIRGSTRVPLATVHVPLPRLDVLAATRTAVFGLGLEAGPQVLHPMMDQDRGRLCGPQNVPDPAHRAYRHGQAAGEVALGGRRILVPRLRARSIDGHELARPSCADAARRDPLATRTLEAIALGVTTRTSARSTRSRPGEARGRSRRAASEELMR